MEKQAHLDILVKQAHLELQSQCGLEEMKQKSCFFGDPDVIDQGRGKEHEENT